MGTSVHLRAQRDRTGIRPLAEDGLVAQAAALVGMSAWSCRLTDDALEWTQGVFDIFGLPLDNTCDRRDTVALYCEESRELLERLRSAAIRERSGFTLDARVRRPDGDERWIRIAANTRVENGRSVQLYGMKQDITQERLQWDRLRRQAENDALTGLGNRARFQSEFLDLPTGSERLARIGALAVFDLNDFKGINDRWGHAAGDACLARFASRLARAFPQARLVARIGGDEFAMLLPATLPAPAAETMLRHRLSTLVGRVEWRGEQIVLGVSAGMAFTDPLRRRSPDETFAAADLALYAAKRSGRNVLRVAA